MKIVHLSDKDYEILEQHFNAQKVKLKKVYCKYCGDEEKDVPFVTDHIVPRCKGGGEEPENKQRICWRCNAAKGPDDEKVFIEWMKRVRKIGRHK